MAHAVPVEAGSRLRSAREPPPECASRNQASPSSDPGSVRRSSGWPTSKSRRRRGYPGRRHHRQYPSGSCSGTRVPAEPDPTALYILFTKGYGVFPWGLHHFMLANPSRNRCDGSGGPMTPPATGAWIAIDRSIHVRVELAVPVDVGNPTGSVVPSRMRALNEAASIGHPDMPPVPTDQPRACGCLPVVRTAYELPCRR